MRLPVGGRETAWSANLKFILLQGIYWSGYCALLGFATIFLTGLGFRNSQSGMIIAAASVGAVLFQTVLAAAADRFPRCSIRLMAGALATATAVLAVPLMCGISRAATVPVFLIASLLMISIQTLLNSLSMEYRSNGIAVDYGITRGAGSLFYAASSFAMGRAVAVHGVQMLPRVYFVMFLLMVLVLFLLKDHRAEQVRSTEEGYNRGIPGFIRQYPRFMILVFGAALVFTCYNMCSSYLIRIMERLGGGSAQVGTALAVASVLEVPVMAAYSFLVRRVGCSRLFRLGAVFLTVKALAICLAPAVGGVYAAQLIQTVSYALFIPSSVYYVDRVMGERDKVKGQSLMVTATTMGGVCGNLLGGWLLDYMGLSAMLWTGAVLSGAGSVIMVLFMEYIGAEGKSAVEKRR